MRSDIDITVLLQSVGDQFVLPHWPQGLHVGAELVDDRGEDGSQVGKDGESERNADDGEDNAEDSTRFVHYEY